jgi:hypothetical protein
MLATSSLPLLKDGKIPAREQVSTRAEPPNLAADEVYNLPHNLCDTI